MNLNHEAEWVSFVRKTGPQMKTGSEEDNLVAQVLSVVGEQG
jgi:hypothetical protein